MSQAKRDELRARVETLREQITAKAEILVHEVMPEKILQLDELYRTSPLLNIADISKVFTLTGIPYPVEAGNQGIEGKAIKDSSSTAGSSSSSSSHSNSSEAIHPKKRRHEDDDAEERAKSSVTDEENTGLLHKHLYKGLVPYNKLISDILEILKKEIQELISICNTVKMWIQLNIPRIEDGNNFGVSIQEETVNELSRAEDSGFSVLESIKSYFQLRGKLCAKVLKYPNLEDHRKAVIEFDEKQYQTLRLCVMDLRNNYAILYDVIHKNLDKIKKPRSQNSVSLY